MISLRRPFSTSARIWILVAGIGQATMPGIASVVDAAGSATFTTEAMRPRIESHGSPKSPRLHQEDTCPLCQFVNGVVATAPGDPPAPTAAAHSSRVAVAPQVLAVWLVKRDPGLPRAPPSAA